MKTSSHYWLLIACVGLLTVVWCPRAAYADSVTLTGPSTINLTEDGSSPVFTYTLSNPASGTPLNNLVTILIGSLSGDLTDGPLLINFVPGGVAPCGGTLAAGSSCTMQLQLLLPNDPGETDADSGSFGLQPVVSWDGGTATENITINVCDPGASACAAAPVPEPSSLLLLGSGLFGLCLCFAWTGARKKVAQA